MDYNVQTDITSVINAEEALEQSPVKKFPGIINLKIDPKPSDVYLSQECVDVQKEHAKKLEVFEKVASEKFDDHILFKHRRRKKKDTNLVKSELNKSVTSLSSTSSEEKDSYVNRPCMLNISTIGTIVPDLRSPDSILTDIENKEKILADMLNLDKLKIDLDKINNTLETKTNGDPTRKTEKEIKDQKEITRQSKEEILQTKDQTFRQKHGIISDESVEAVVTDSIPLSKKITEVPGRLKNNQDSPRKKNESIVTNVSNNQNKTVNKNDSIKKTSVNGSFNTNYGNSSGFNFQNPLEPPGKIFI